jgi:hydroxypyruvate reductase/glycerate 2-kinase
MKQMSIRRYSLAIAKMTHIKNTNRLISNGNVSLRRPALDIIEHALSAVDPYAAVRNLVHLDGDKLTVGHLELDRTLSPRIFIIGSGKATYPIAKALEEMLGDRITDGVVICKYGQEGTLERSKLYLADHPIPDEAGLLAAKEALKQARRTQPGDVVFGCITGGSSALMPLPVEGISLDEKKHVNRLLLTCGANIVEINAVRKHLSQIKGGRLAAAMHPEAHLINLTVSDVIGDPLDYITDPTVPDTSTFDDARATLSKYDLWPHLPDSVVGFLRSAGQDQENPKGVDLARHKRNNFIIISASEACEAASAKATDLGFQSMILSSMFEGESRELGRTFAAIAKEVVQNRRPLEPPCVIIGGGETTVKIDGLAGKGGPNQEFALGAAPYIAGIGSVLIAGLDSDGTDGPTESAGGLVDDQTLYRARRIGINLFDGLSNHDVTPIFRKLGDEIYTGATGTNVNDLKLMVILPQQNDV